MKALVVYDSLHGNTETIAKAIGEAIGGDVEVRRAGEVDSSEVGAVDLLIVGAPTHGGRASEPAQDFLNKIPSDALQGVDVAAFDTRMTTVLVRIFGYAAPKIAGKLQKLGGTLVGKPEGFFVTGGKGPLKEGEVERAAGWIKGIVGQ
jgi:flavodoxin